MTGEEERIEMEIRKRNGESVPFQQEKIFNAIHLYETVVSLRGALNQTSEAQMDALVAELRAE